MADFETPIASVMSVDLNKWVTSREDEGDIINVIGDELPQVIINE